MANWQIAVITSGTAIVTLLISQGFTQWRDTSTASRERLNRWEVRTVDVYFQASSALSKANFAIAGLAIATHGGYHQLSKEDLEKLIHDTILEILSERERIRFLCPSAAFTAFEDAFREVREIERLRDRRGLAPDDDDWREAFARYETALSKFMSVGQATLKVPTT